MSRVRKFVRTSVLGGLVVLLPVGVLFIVFHWLYGKLRNLLEPVTGLIAQPINDFLRDVLPERLAPTTYGWAVDLIAFIVVVSVMIAICFLTGILLKTALGRWFHNRIEEYVLKLAPGYNLVKETVLQFFGDKPSPFRSVAFVRIFGNELPTMVTAFVTERHSNGWFTVFVPTGPNPTSGQIFHVPGECVCMLDQPVEDVMRSVISCGAGSDKLMATYQRMTVTSASVTSDQAEVSRPHR